MSIEELNLEFLDASNESLKDKMILPLQGRTNYFWKLTAEGKKKGDKRYYADPWLAKIKKIINSKEVSEEFQKMSVEEEMNKLFKDVDPEIPDELINRWKHIEAVLDGSLTKLFNRLSKANQLAEYFNNLLKLDKEKKFKKLVMKKLRHNQKDQFALNSDIILIDENEEKKKVVLIELKNNAKYTFLQYLKYDRLLREIERQGYEVYHILIGKHQLPQRWKSFAVHSTKWLEWDKENQLRVKISEAYEKVHLRAPTWEDYYVNTFKNNNNNPYPIHIFNYQNLLETAEKNFEKYKDEFQFIVKHFK